MNNANEILRLLRKIDDGYIPKENEKKWLSNLKTLDFTGTQITYLPDSIGRLANLQVLDLSYTTIETLPNSIGMLTNLLTLDLYDTQITSLPACISNLINLQTLDISGTKIKSLPDNIGKLANLQMMDISYTRITSLPDSIGSLPNLKKLDLSFLSLDSIPESLALKGLQFVTKDYYSFNSGINLYNTVLEKQPIAIFLETPDLIPDLYKDQTAARECKVIFLGDGEAGKSYTIKRFLSGGKRETKRHPYTTTETPGVEIVDFHVILENNDGFDIHFWDFGGQQILHSMHRCFLTEQTCYVVVVKTRDTKATQRARYWLRNITAFAPASPVLLLVNCWDNDDGKRSIDEASLCIDYPQIADVVYCSSKTAEDSDFRAFMDRLEDMVVNSKGFNRTVNRSWEEVRRRLAEENKDYLTKERYYEICKECGIENANAPDLLTYFNVTGVCFSYHRDRDHNELTEYKLLNPVWLTNAIYAVIEEGMPFAQNGNIKADGIRTLLGNTPPEMLNGKKYKRTMPGITYESLECDYVIDVAAAHNLCYRIDEDTLFFPALCTNNTPVEELTNPGDYSLPVDYRLKYAYLPDSVVHMLMIRCMRKDLAVNNRWLRGMIIGGMDKHKAVIKMDDDDMTLKIDIYSKEGTPAYELFNLLREEILAVNYDLNLTADEYIAKGEDAFHVSALLAAAKDNTNVYGKNGDKYPAAELLGNFYDKRTIKGMCIKNGTLMIPLLPREYHKCEQGNIYLRQALFDEYDEKCAYCGLLLDPNNMWVDHILPKRPKLKNDEDMRVYLEELKSLGFDLNNPDYVENYFPTCPHCNQTKSNDLMDVNMLAMYHYKAAKHTPDVLKRMEKYEERSRKAKK